MAEKDRKGRSRVGGFVAEDLLRRFPLEDCARGLFRRSALWRQQGHGRLEDDRPSRGARRFPRFRRRGQALSLWTGQPLRKARLMAQSNKPVDVVIVGFGWTGA